MATSTRSSTDTLPDTPAGVLAALRAEQDARQASEVRSMSLAAHWVALHPVLDPSCPDACFQSPKTLAGQGSPAIDEFTIPDIATMLGQTCDAVGSYLTDVIELRYRLPQLWAGILAGLVTPWRARRIAQTTVGLTPEAAGFVDEQTAWCANRLTPTELSRLVDHARARFMPDQLAKETEDAADRRHVTFDTDRVSFDGTPAPRGRPRPPRRPRLRPRPSPPVPPTSCDWARPTRWTGAGPPPSATSPATSSRSASPTTTTSTGNWTAG
ncbi:13E12 repeat family protein [Nocardioides sp. B-3]|uniref:13E12 repeat family protein n=1 Tax=Nocardioides sp. B-3 TaxID=2895565 RepID=UPI002152D092|nr:13E12 repeat family protein [Nocardioides sp. B-3]UUZ57883.1 13E12 repeat family protein [Nocardioides sp. B-3]